MIDKTFPSPLQFTRRSLSALWIGAMLLGAAGAQAVTPVSPLADVRLVERHSGRVLPLYYHQGEYWVAGRPGANYSIDITNRTGGRIMAVISVDGVNAITGQSASSAPKDGYVFNAWQHWAITGWRKSDREVAAFYFSESDASYASRIGRPRDVGVIGVALFRERPQEPVRPSPPIARGAPMLEEREAAASSSTLDAAPVLPEPVSPRAAEKSADAMAGRSPQANASPAPKLGTGHGALESSFTSEVDFEAATRRPEQTVRIRYDSHANLVARGVIPAPRGERRPNPFPAGGNGDGFVPDPPRW